MKAVNCPHKNREAFAWGLCKSCYNIVQYHFYPGRKEAARAKEKRMREKYPEKFKIKNREWRANNKKKYWKSIVKSQIKWALKRGYATRKELIDIINEGRR